MANIAVNDKIWGAISPTEQSGIISHLQQHDVLQPGDTIVSDPGTPIPDQSVQLYSGTIGEIAGMKALGWGNPICKIACDAAAAAAAAACTATGPGLAACLAAIAAARSHCRSRC